jgi:hypothetical protein
MSAPISEVTLQALRVCSETPAELEKLLMVYEMGYLQSMMDAITAQANATQQEK